VDLCVQAIVDNMANSPKKKVFIIAIQRKHPKQ